MNITIELGGPLADAINKLAAAIEQASNMNAVLARDVIQFAELSTQKTPTEKASTTTKPRTKKPEPVNPEVISRPYWAEPAAEAPAPEPAAEAPATAPQDSTEPAPTFTQKDLHTEILRVARDKGHDAAAAILAQFGARKISEVKDADLGAAIKAAKES